MGRCHHAGVTRPTRRTPRPGASRPGAGRPGPRASAPGASRQVPSGDRPPRPEAASGAPLPAGPGDPAVPAGHAGPAVPARPAGPDAPARIAAAVRVSRVPARPGPLPLTAGAPGRDPLAGAERILVDGSNLLHALRRGAGPAPAATLIGRLRAIIPPSVRIELVFDGPPEHGLRGTRIAAGLTVRHSGRYTADSLIDRLVADAIGTGGDPEQAYAVGAAILVVTDDIELARMIRRRGARTIGADWLVRRLDRPALSSPSVGASRPPRAASSPAAGTDPDRGDDRPGWRPGRGATKKTGNPKRGHPSGPANRFGG
jgi:hypothetical protein